MDSYHMIILFQPLKTHRLFDVRCRLENENYDFIRPHARRGVSSKLCACSAETRDAKRLNGMLLGGHEGLDRERWTGRIVKGFGQKVPDLSLKLT